MDLFNDFSIGLFVWQTVLFLALLFLLRKYAWKPILSAVEEREEGIKNALEAADNAKKEMEALNADNERILREAKAESDNLLKEAHGWMVEHLRNVQADTQKVVITDTHLCLLSKLQASEFYARTRVRA